MTGGARVNFFVVGILVLMFLVGLSSAGSKKRGLKPKSRQKQKAKASAQASHTTIKISQATKGGRDSTWTMVLPQARQAAREHGAELVGKGILREGEPDGPNDGPNPYGKWEITEAARTRLRNLVIKAIDNGWTVNQLQHEILQDGIIVNVKFPAACALTIAWTETAFARAHGSYQAAKETGMKYKRWILGGSVGNYSDCAICQANARQGRIRIDEPFQSGVNCAPGHTRCRCSVGYYETKYGD
jgi:hypothetical protein